MAGEHIFGLIYFLNTKKTQSFYKSSIYQQMLEFCSKQYITKCFLQIGPRWSRVDQLNILVDISNAIQISLLVVKWHEYVFYDKNFNLIQENKDTSNRFLAFGLRNF